MMMYYLSLAIVGIAILFSLVRIVRCRSMARQPQLSAFGWALDGTISLIASIIVFYYIMG